MKPSDYRILIIDDTEAVRKFAKVVLEQKGFQVELLKDGIEGLQYVSKHEPDLVLLDFVMPRMNGYHFLRALDAKKLIPLVPIIMMSTLIEKLGERLSRVSRVRECLQKPFSPEQLVAAVGRHIVPDEPTAPAILVDVGDADVEELDDTWLVIANIREKLHQEVADAFGERVDDLVKADDRHRVLGVIADMLGTMFDEEFTREVVELVQEREP